MDKFHFVFQAAVILCWHPRGDRTTPGDNSHWGRARFLDSEPALAYIPNRHAESFVENMDKNHPQEEMDLVVRMIHQKSDNHFRLGSTPGRGVRGCSMLRSYACLYL